ncbi:protein of unknown function [Filomicrobium insigne]|uniref:DUF1788 domain-containing protein n=1 Tax=Filomicrobium insigne TaxID=418854 RepID=A0A1H0N2M6_9HYPH|nr:BREX protein BrxB domain-containing protein [Filomicrobium insigne]SDO86969.1 protein of unknown function [Filomicrobium insigne]
MSELQYRITRHLEPALSLADPRPRLSAYHDMPYAIFRYGAEDEFELRSAVRRLKTRLENTGKRVTEISLAECLQTAIESERPLESWYGAERETEPETIAQTLSNLFDDRQPLVDMVGARMPAEADPLQDIVFIVRTGALFPVYRTFSLLEQLKGRVVAPTILFYPGDLDGAAGLRFMGVFDAEHNYRPKIF